MKRSYLVKLLIATLIGGSLAGFSNTEADAAEPQNPEVFHLLEVFGQALEMSESQHVTPIDHKRAIQAAIAGMLQSLDPHSDYIRPEVYAEMFNPAGSIYGSLGLELKSDDGRIIIVQPIEGAPGARAGLLAGDELTAIDGQNIRGQPIENAIDHLRGSLREPTILTVVRGPGPAFNVTVSRQQVTVHPVRFAMTSAYGNLHILSLDGAVVHDVREAVLTIKSKNLNAQGLVLDLRDCPGGALSSAVAVAGMFVNGGEIMSERGRLSDDVRTFSTTNNADIAQGLPIVVLVNAGTGSGCEIIAAALQDRKRAKIVGMPTFGQGSIQTIIPINQGKDGAVKLTTAFVYRPSGKPLQALGVLPDFLVAQSKEQAESFMAGRVFSEATFANALDIHKTIPEGSPPIPEQPPSGFSGDFQFRRGLELLAEGAAQGIKQH